VFSLRTLWTDFSALTGRTSLADQTGRPSRPLLALLAVGTTLTGIATFTGYTVLANHTG
jgi:hypothetical protein